MEDDDAASEAAPPAAPTFDVPVVIVTHLSRGIDELDAPQARQLIAGEIDNWSSLGEDAASMTILNGNVFEAEDNRQATPTDPDEAVDEVAENPDALAIVTAADVTPRVRALRVDDIDPLRTPEDYPLLTSASEEPGAVLVTSIVGDIMLGRRVGDSLERQGDLSAAFRPFAERLAGADITVGNFEATLSQEGPPTQGTDSFVADTEALDGLDLAGFDVISLGNNHLGDFGQQSIDDTVDRMADAGFATTGGGRNLDEAREPAIVERDGISVGFIATDSIGETPAATDEQGGTNRVNAPPRTGPLDEEALERVSDDIWALDAEVDIVMVVPHWGTQYTHEPEDSQRVMAEAFTDAGADLVAGGHPHWVQGWEQMGDATVIHSLGNFIFDMDFMEKTMEGVFVEVVSWGDQIVAIEPVPFKMDDDFTPREPSAEVAESIIGDIASTSSAPFDSLR